MSESTGKHTEFRPVRVRRLPELPPRASDGHKGTFGRVLVVAGSRGMAGAASLTGRGALHGGAGSVTVATPDGMCDLVASFHPSYMTVPLPDQAGQLAAASAGVLLGWMDGYSVVALGPGLGRSRNVQSAVQQLYREVPIPMVLDADGLNAFAMEPDVALEPALETALESEQKRQLLTRQAGSAARVLTPHVGEFSRLTGISAEEISVDRERLAFKFAREQRIVLLLKGAGTVITDGHRLFVNTSGCSALATGGSGDVLTGLIAAQLAQGMDAFDAACLAAHVHGLAGEIAAERSSPQFVTSVEILAALGPAWRQLQRGG